MFFLPTDRRWLAMTRIDNRIIRQRPELLPDAAKQSTVITTRQVRPTDASPEQHIASDQESPFRIIKPNASRRMTRQKQDLQAVFIQFDGPARNQEIHRAPIILERHPPLQPHGWRHRKDLLLICVEMKW